MNYLIQSDPNGGWFVDMHDIGDRWHDFSILNLAAKIRDHAVEKNDLPAEIFLRTSNMGPELSLHREE